MRTGKTMRMMGKRRQRRKTSDSRWTLLMLPQVVPMVPSSSNTSRRCSPWVTDA